MNAWLNRGLLLAASVGLVCSLILISTVTRSGADILDLSSGPSRSDAEFVRVLEAMGHERFETYKINGQTIHTSVRHEHNMSPTRLLRDYQRQLVAHGINDRAYFDLQSGTSKQRLFSGLKGGLVPFRYEDDHIAMGGVVTENHATSDHEVLQAVESMAGSPGSFKGFRNIEIMKPTGSRRTTVFASWSDELDYESFQAGSEELNSPKYDDDIAVCPSCVRIHHFAHPRRALTDRGVHLFSGKHTPSVYGDWYAQEFRRQGFSLEPFQELDSLMHRAAGFRNDSQMLVFRKDALVRVLTLYRADDTTFAHIHTQLTMDEPEENEK